MAEMTPKRAKVLKALRQKEHELGTSPVEMTPTQIGFDAGGIRERPESYAHPVLKWAEKAGYVENGVGDWRLTRLGRAEADDLLAEESGGDDDE